MKFADKVRVLRTGLDLTVTELAKLTGIGASSIREYEAARRRPHTLDDYRKLAQALETSVAYLRTDDDEAAPSYHNPNALKDSRASLNRIRNHIDAGYMSRQDLTDLLADLDDLRTRLVPHQ